LAFRYGEDGGRIRDVEGGSWFEASITKSVGNNFNTFFRSDCWVGPTTLRKRFRRLYDLSIQNDKTVGEMSVLGWGDEGDAWRWRRRLMA